MPFGEVAILLFKLGKLIGRKLGELSHLLIEGHDAVVFP